MAMDKFNMKRKKGYFSISAVSKMFSVHQQTVRLYEKEGLIIPKRSSGNTRMFTEEDVNKLEEIIYLTHQLGINLAGVQMILKLQKQIKKMQKDMNKIFDDTNEELTKNVEVSKQIVETNAKQLLKIKKQVEPKSNFKEDESSATVDIDNWKLDYDD